MFFLLFLLADRRIQIRISDKWIWIREVRKHVDPTDPDPQHWLAYILNVCRSKGHRSACYIPDIFKRNNHLLKKQTKNMHKLVSYDCKEPNLNKIIV
jgi:hypothetical protein